MRQNLALAFCLFIFLAAPARADSLPSADDIRKALAAGDVTIDDYTLDHDDLGAFYTARDFRPAWNFAGPENAAALNAFLDSIDKAIAWHGLQREDYPLDIMRRRGARTDDDSQLKLELLVTDTLLLLAHDLHGDYDLDQLYPGWNFHRDDIDIPGMLAQAVASNGVNDLITNLTPKNPAYGDLARALHEYSNRIAKGDWPVIDEGPILRPGDRGARVAQMRARLEAEDYLEPITGKKAVFFDSGLRKALADYQTHNGLEPDGHLGAKTQEALNVPLKTRIDQILANMERWRHMPEDFPPARAAIVNIPDESIAITDGGNTVYQGPVIVGQVERKTPFIQSEIRSMIVNPAWHVPQKIAREDILPKLRKDPHYLEKLGFVIRDSDYDPHGKTIDWKNISDDEFNFRLRQEPGKMNSLGRLKFDFANDFAVYLHGTPHQELFKKNERALSSGCVRLRDPQMVAQIILEGTPGLPSPKRSSGFAQAGDWDDAHIEDAIAARKTRWIEIKNPMPIYILYWTAFAGKDGRLQFRSDIYDYDRFLIENLKSGSEASELTIESGSNPQVP